MKEIGNLGTYSYYEYCSVCKVDVSGHDTIQKNFLYWVFTINSILCIEGQIIPMKLFFFFQVVIVLWNYDPKMENGTEYFLKNLNKFEMDL